MINKEFKCIFQNHPNRIIKFLSLPTDLYLNSDQQSKQYVSNFPFNLLSEIYR